MGRIAGEWNYGLTRSCQSEPIESSFEGLGKAGVEHCQGSLALDDILFAKLQYVEMISELGTEYGRLVNSIDSGVALI